MRVTDIALEGFRVSRERPAVAAACGLIVAAWSVLQNLAVTALAGPAVARAAALIRGGTAPTDPAFQTVATQVAPASLLAQAAAVLVFAVVSALVLRATLSPEEPVLKPRADGSALRQAAVLALLVLTLFVVAATLGFVLGALLSVLGAAPAAAQAFLFLAAVAAAAVVFVRFSLAGPETFVARRVRFLASWRATKGRFWPLLGAYALAGALAVFVSLLAQLVLTSAFAALPGGGLQSFAELQVPKATLPEAVRPAALAAQALAGFVNGLTLVLLIAPGAAAWRALNGRPA